MPSYDWKDPKTWQAGEALTPAKLNAYIGEQNDFLRYRNRVQTLSTTGYIMTAASLTALADNEFRHLFDVKQNEDVLLTLEIIYNINTVTAATYFDIFIDDDYYLSSGLTTPLTRGSFSKIVPEANQNIQINFRRLIRNLSAGEHSFSLHAARTAGTVNFVRVKMETEGY